MLHLDEFCKVLWARARAETTIASYRASIEDFARRMEVSDPTAVDAAMLDRYMTRLALSGNSAATRTNRGHAVKAFFRFLAARKLIADNPADEWALPEKKRDSVSILSEGEIERIIFGFVARPAVRGPKERADWFERRRRRWELAAARDTAMLAVAYNCGLRASEIGKLRFPEDYSVDGKGRGAIRIMGKAAKKPHVKILDRRTRAALESFLSLRLARGVRHPALFPPFTRPAGAKEYTGRGVSVAYVRRALASRIRACGIEAKGRRLSPHVLRYSICNHLARTDDNPRGLSDRDLQQFMRHASVETTWGYLLTTSDSVRSTRANASLYWNRRPGRRPEAAAALAR